MKYCILILPLVTFALSCNSYKKGTVQTDTSNSKAIQENIVINFIGKDFHKWTGKQLQFEKIESLQYDLNKDGVIDSILVERIKGWESEPGDFQSIRIEMSGEKSFVLQNTDGWIKIKNVLKYDHNFDSDNLVQSDYVVLKNASNENLLLFMEGYVYASKPGFLSIINIYKNKSPVFVFNDNVELFKFHDYNNDGVKDLAATVWDGFYADEQKNKYRFEVYLVDGGFTLSNEYSRVLSEEIFEDE